MGLLDLCKKYFQSDNLYEVLGISEEATEKDVKKAYHKLSLKVHPDRVKEDEKLEATEKFKVLGSVHAILSDKEKRAVYDETKSVDDDDFNVINDRDWTVYWRLLFKKITVEDIKAYEKEYIGSEDERKDLKHAYLIGKGDMDYIADHVQFARSEHEPRYKEIINGVGSSAPCVLASTCYCAHLDAAKRLEMISKGEVPSYKIFTHEPAKKRQRRHAKENREAKESEQLEKELGLDTEANSLELMIRQKQENRAQQMDSFLDNLAAKYGGENKTPKQKATKRKAALKAEPTRTSKRRK